MSPIVFEPITYDYAAWLIGRRPWDVSRDGTLLLEAHRAAIDRFRQRSCVVGIDLYNLEAEACGCAVEEPAGNGTPTIMRAFCASPEEVLALRFNPASDGRVPMVLDAAENLKRCRPECDIRVPVCGPFSLAGHLLGLENLLCRLMTDREAVDRALLHLAENLAEYARAAAARGLGATIFESAAAPPLVSPALFASIVSPAIARLMGQATLLAKQRPHFIMGGDVVTILDEILSLNPSYTVCPVETNQTEYLRRMLLRTDIFVRVNMNPRVFTQGDHTVALAEARRAREIAAMRSRTSVGSIVPLDTEPEVVQAVAEFFESGQ